MKKLFVGCRVRIAACDQAQTVAGKFVGMEGRITSNDVESIDGANYEVSCAPGFGFFAHELEPIQPSGHRPSEYTFTELMDRCRAGEVECV